MGVSCRVLSMELILLINQVANDAAALCNGRRR